MPQDFSGQNLRGRSFKGQNLTGANFSNADIRGADFTDAILRGANFSYAKAGLQRRWVLGLVLVSCLMSGISGFFAAWFAVTTTYVFKSTDRDSFILGVVYFIVSVVFFIVAPRKGLIAGLAAGVGAVVVAGTVAGTYAIAGAVTAVGDEVGVVAIAVAVAGAYAVAGAVAAAGVGAFAVIGTVAGVATECRPCMTIYCCGAIVAYAIAYAVAFTLLNTYISWRALGGDEKNAWVRSLAIAFAATGGTSFRGADLTYADFTQVTLKNADLRKANLTRTRFYQAKELNYARVGNSILAKAAILDLLISANGREKSYVGANLRGANLTGADLTKAIFKQADISEATFQGARLEQANLTLTQAIGTDFTSAFMTGACLEAWNIESTTILDNVDCRYIYLLENPKPGTSDRERRPSSGEFKPGEFTKLFQEIINTVDLIFQNGIDWKAFVTAFKKLQVENEETELAIQSIENKGDGVIVIKVSVPFIANKEKIHSEFIQNYELALKAIEEKYQAKLEAKDELIINYRQQLDDYRSKEYQQSADIKEIISLLASKPVNLPVNVAEIKAIAKRQSLTNQLVILSLGDGDFECGFSSVTAQIWTGGHKLPIQHIGQLPPAPEIPELYSRCLSIYKGLNLRLPIKAKSKSKSIQMRDFSQKDIYPLALEMEELLNKWLNSETFRPIDKILREKFVRSDEVTLILQSENFDARRLPWHLWDFFKSYRKAEVALSVPFYDRVEKTAIKRANRRILAILGNSDGIDLEEDRKVLENLCDTETVFLLEPNRQELDQQLWDEKGWDVLCFSGHSSSQWDARNGWIYINKTDKLMLDQLENALRAAIERGLQLAIFNSCDGLGLARHLASLHIPQIIVMRELVPDVVAQEFLKNFLTAFATDKSFYMAVRQAREKLQGLENDFPCATWLPVICQNPAEIQ